MRRNEQIKYYLAREQQEIALSLAPGDAGVQAIHREMARLYGERASVEAARPLPRGQVKVLVASASE